MADQLMDPPVLSLCDAGLDSEHRQIDLIVATWPDGFVIVERSGRELLDDPFAAAAHVARMSERRAAFFATR